MLSCVRMRRKFTTRSHKVLQLQLVILQQKRKQQSALRLIKGRAFTRDDPRANAIMKWIMEMLALDDLPFNFVNNTGFQRLMKHVEPRYTMPYEKFFRTRMLPDMYTAVRTEVQDVIANAEHISFTTNAWTMAQCTDSLLID